MMRPRGKHQARQHMLHLMKRRLKGSRQKINKHYNESINSWTNSILYSPGTPFKYLQFLHFLMKSLIRQMKCFREYYHK
mgnify:CR=1 FL=1